MRAVMNSVRRIACIFLGLLIAPLQEPRTNSVYAKAFVAILLFGYAGYLAGTEGDEKPATRPPGLNR
jgi:hypothetical protein